MKSILITLLMLLPTMGFSGTKTIELTKDNSISFNQSFNAEYIAQKQVELISLAKRTTSKDIYIVLNTPGGSISAGKLFIDTVNGLGKNIHTITIFAASMGYQTVQGLGKRYILPSGTLMSHRGYASGLKGQVPGELNVRVDMLLKMVTQMEEVSSARVGLTLAEYKDKIRDELWLVGGQYAVEQGHADEVILAKCGDSLTGSKIETFRTIFGPVEVEFSNCPIVTAPLSIRFSGNKRAENQVRSFYDNIFNFVDSKL